MALRVGLGGGVLMAKISFPGLRDYELRLSRLGDQAPSIIGKAVYAGADIVADAVRSGIKGLPERSGVTKRGLEDGFGISPMQDDSGYLNVKLGFDGYNADGVPNVLMARVMESGTSKVPKHPFVRPAVNQAKGAAEARMAEVIDEEIDKLMK